MIYGLLTLALLSLVVTGYFALRTRQLSTERSVSAQQHTSLIEQQQATAQQLAALSQENAHLKQRLQGITDIEAERTNLQAEVARIRVGAQSAVQRFQEQRQRAEQEAQEERRRIEQQLQGERGRTEAEINSLKFKINGLRAELDLLDEEATLQSFGFYKPRYGFESSARYQEELEAVRARQKTMLQQKSAAFCSIEWTVNGSSTEGRKQINQTLKLMVRAFNGESDAAIAKVRYNNVSVMEARINKAYQALNALAQVQQCTISTAYRDLKLQELALVHEYQEKLQGEKEEQRLIREQMREEEVAQREIERAKQDAEREERRYSDALTKARMEVEQAVGAKQQKLLRDIEELQRRLTEAQSNKARAIAQAQLTRLGHVYVISNIGSFGDNVYKIGMTRRLDPLDRVRELGDASVPFLFDVHALIRSDDAPKLEAALHRAFHHRRVNRINERREFFRVTLDEITKIVHQNHGEIEFTQMADAKEYRQTVAMNSAT